MCTQARLVGPSPRWLRLTLGLGLAACSATGSPVGSGASTGSTGISGSTATSTGSGTSGSSTASSTSSASSSASSGSGGTSGGPACPAGPGYPGRHLVEIDQFQATVQTVDSSGADAGPLTGSYAQLCGLLICLTPQLTDAQGQVSFHPRTQIDTPAFEFGNGYQAARFAFLVTQPTSAASFTTVRLPASGADLTQSLEVTSGEVTLTQADGGAVHLNHIDIPQSDQRLFRAAFMDPGQATPTLDATLGLEALYGLAPTGTTFCPAARLTVPNRPRWAVGTPVEFFLHGIDVRQSWAPYGGWAKFSDGQVNADGTISTDADGGLPLVSTFGIRRRPGR